MPDVNDALVKASKVVAWGNSAAVRIGAAALERAQLHVDDAVDIIATDDEIIIRRQRPKVTISELLARFDPARHRHELELDGPPAGSETR